MILVTGDKGADRLSFWDRRTHMESKWRVTYFKPDRQGDFFTKTSVRFAADMPVEEECGVILYEGDGREQRFPFSAEGKIGTLYGLEIEGEGLSACTYNFYRGKQVLTSPYAREIHGLEKWGDWQEKKRVKRGAYPATILTGRGTNPL